MLSRRTRRQRLTAGLVLLLVAGLIAIFANRMPGIARTFDAQAGPMHFTVNHRETFGDAMQIGFNLADVSSVRALDELPDGAKGILWLRNGYNSDCRWQLDDAKVVEAVQAAKDHPKFSGIYYIADTPHPSVCPDAPERIAERTALIHENDPNGRTFIAVSGGYKFPQEFEQLADSADYLGVTVYPCNVRKPTCEFDKIGERVGRAIDAGIPKKRLVPIFQAFGQACTTNEEPFYRLPSPAELTEILSIWDELLPPATRPFDMTYSWGSQDLHSCPSLEMATGGDFPDLQALYADYFHRMAE